jgi:transcriptional regulator with XRE-family HTH domain
MKLPLLKNLQSGLKRARKNAKTAGNKKMTQKQLADSLGVTVESVRKWEQGNVRPPIDRMYDMCALYKCDMNYLTGVNDCTTQDIQGIKDYTGLSEETITALTSLDDVQKDLLHNLATADNGDLLKLLLGSMFLYCGGHIHDLKAFDIDGVEIPLDREEKAGMTKFEAVDTYSMILQRLYSVYHDFRMNRLKNKIDILEAEIEIQKLQAQIDSTTSPQNSPGTE